MPVGDLASDHVTEDFRIAPLWLDDMGSLPDAVEHIPRAVDALVIGAGYTGLSAARVIAAAGRSTLVVDAGPIGAGCSTRNGGQVAPGIKPDFDHLAAQVGESAAEAIHREGLAAVENLRRRAADGELACDWQATGRFVGAHSPRAFTSLVRGAEAHARRFDQPLLVVSRDAVPNEIATARYHGGIVHPRQASIHPARLLARLAHGAVAQGAMLRPDCAVTGIAREAGGFAVQTAAGKIVARDVVIATNGYTGRFAPWHRRRVIPLCSSIVATEALDPALVQRLLPTGRNIVDTRRLVIYFRASPDGRRIIFGGRAGAFDVPPHVFVPRLLGWLAALFPQLGPVRASHAWSGTVAFTFDHLPHIGSHDGMHYAMGYCGSGIALAVFYGNKLGHCVLGSAEGKTALDALPFQTRPFYDGRPWFVAPSIAAFRVADALGF